jgi:hypothetical protein
MIAGNGWWDFTMPACIAAGQYLMRVELIGTASLTFLTAMTSFLLTPFSSSPFCVRIERCTVLYVVSVSTTEGRL